MARTMRGTAAALFFFGVTAACGGNSGGGDGSGLLALACTPDGERSQLLSTAKDWYLFPDLLAAGISADTYPTPADLLAAITAPARDQKLDRGWSHLTTKVAAQQHYDEGTAVGFGFGLLLRGNKLVVAQVFPGAPALAAGFARGDEVLAIGPTAAALVPVATLVAQDGIGAALGSSQVGTTRAFTVLTAANVTEARVVTTATYSLDPVARVELLRGAAGLPPVGYVQLRTFIHPAEAPLRDAFRSFATAGVTNVIVDLRYNGGGLISTAELLANLLSQGRAGQVMYRMTYNTKHAASATTTPFAAVDGSLPATRIAFVTTGASASASELVVNVLSPYAEVAVVGDHTYGKPVGQVAFELGSCNDLLYLVSIQLRNRDGAGDFFGGLPDETFRGAFCPASDDLVHAPGSADEASTAAAIGWLTAGACPAPVVAARRSALEGAIAPDRRPIAPAPAPWSDEIPGVF